MEGLDGEMCGAHVLGRVVHYLAPTTVSIASPRLIHPLTYTITICYRHHLFYHYHHYYVYYYLLLPSTTITTTTVPAATTDLRSRTIGLT